MYLNLTCWYVRKSGCLRLLVLLQSPLVDVHARDLEGRTPLHIVPRPTLEGLKMLGAFWSSGSLGSVWDVGGLGTGDVGLGVKDSGFASNETGVGRSLGSYIKGIPGIDCWRRVLIGM